MDFFEKYPAIIEITLFFVGFILSSAAHYISFAEKLAFIKGQLDLLLKFNEGLSDIIEKSARIDLAMKTFDSLDARVDLLEKKFLNGGSYGRNT